MRLFDSVGTGSNQYQQANNPNKVQSTTSQQGLTLQQHQQQQQRYNLTNFKQTRMYYQGEDTKNPSDYRSSRFNMEQSWNPVNNYVYGVSMQSVYNQPEKESQTHRKLERILNINANVREKNEQRMRGGGGGHVVSSGANDVEFFERDAWGKVKNRHEKSQSQSSNRRLLGEFLNNEAPRLCDHAIDFYDTDSVKKRYCTPVESYISTGRDMVRCSKAVRDFRNFKFVSYFFFPFHLIGDNLNLILWLPMIVTTQKLEFHTATGTALYPYSFSLNYEFVDTEMGGEPMKFDGKTSRASNNKHVDVDEDKKMENEFSLCSRTFKSRRGEFRSPRNVFLHGRGGAKNLSCLYRFEAKAGEQVSTGRKEMKIY